MKRELQHGILAVAVLVALSVCCNAQVLSSHTQPKAAAAVAAPTQPSGLQPGQPVARVNGAVLTDRDLMREIQTIFPYTKMHNGIPKSMPEMRKGALEMIIFEELVYQEALRRKMVVAPERMKKAEQQFRRQFTSEQELQQVLDVEVHGSRQLMRDKIRRALLIEDLLKSDVTDKAAVSVAEARAYYTRHPEKFQHSELFKIQTISIIPPENANPDVVQEARTRAQNALKQAKTTKTYQEFGLLAERVSDDDWHVNMGDRKEVAADKLPPEIVRAAKAMKNGQVSDLIQLGPAYTLFRLNGHVAAGVRPFDEVKATLATDLQKEKNDRLRSQLNQRLRKSAKIEVM